MTARQGMDVVFTGTQHGMSEEQKANLIKFFQTYYVKTLRHGGCIGADEECHFIAKIHSDCEILVYPSTVTAKQSIAVLSDSSRRVWLKRVEEPLKRNRLMVDAGPDMCLVAPLTDREIVRSGTWATARYARKLGRRMAILWRDGSVKLDNWPARTAFLAVDKVPPS